MSMLPVWNVTAIGSKLGIQCPRKECKGKAVVAKKWATKRITSEGVLIVGRPCTYCFKTAQVPEEFSGGKPRG